MLNKKEKINVIVASDKNYAQHMGVAIYSILKNSKNPSEILFWILDGGISKEDKVKINKQIKRFNSSCRFINISNLDEMKNFKSYGHLSKMAFARILFSKFIKGVNRVIYLDSDIIFLTDIKNLYETSLDKNIIGAAQEITGFLWKEHLNLLDLDYLDYFNSGVLLIDVNLWNKNDISKKCLNLFKNKKEIIKFGDQEILNIALKGKWKKLDYSWNPLFAYHKDLEFDKKIKDEIKLIRKNPKIIHYGGGKNAPWKYASAHPMRKEYYRYLSKTDWKNFKQNDRNFKNLFKKIINIIILRIPHRIKKKLIVFKRKL